MLEQSLGKVPENLRPIFEARTAHSALRAALEVIEGTPESKQAQLLKDPIFQKVVFSALGGLDECRRGHALEIVGAFSPELTPEAHRIIIDESN